MKNIHVLQGFVFGLLAMTGIMYAVPANAEVTCVGSNPTYCWQPDGDIGWPPSVSVYPHVSRAGYSGLFGAIVQGHVYYEPEVGCLPGCREDRGEWTGTMGEFLAQGLPPENPSNPSSFIPVASSTALIDHVWYEYGYFAFAGLAGFLAMMLAIRFVIFLYNKVRSRFGDDDVEIV